MATWEDLDNESGLEKDEAEDEANVVVGLVATMASDAKSGTNFENENEVYSKLTRSELIDSVKVLLSHFETRSKELKELKGRYLDLLKIHQTTILDMENIEAENRYFKQMTDKWSKKPLSEQDIAFQGFILTGIDKRKVASMIYNVRRTKGEQIGFSEDYGKPNTTHPPCFDCIKKGLNAYFMSKADKSEFVIQSELKASDSKTMNNSKSNNPKFKVVNNFEFKTSKIQILMRPEPKSQVLMNSKSEVSKSKDQIRKTIVATRDSRPKGVKSKVLNEHKPHNFKHKAQKKTKPFKTNHKGPIKIWVPKSEILDVANMLKRKGKV